MCIPFGFWPHNVAVCALGAFSSGAGVVGCADAGESNTQRAAIRTDNRKSNLVVFMALPWSTCPIIVFLKCIQSLAVRLAAGKPGTFCESIPADA
jgi:hypothetical protein